MRNKRKERRTFFIIMAILAISGAMVAISITLQRNVEIIDVLAERPSEDETYLDTSELNGLPFTENYVYDEYDDNGLYYVYVTVLPTTNEKTGAAVTMADLNNVREQYQNPVVNIIFEPGDKQGPYDQLYESNAMVPNASMKVRGFSSRRSPQKSFKVNLSGNTEPYFGQQVLNFNKHKSDPLRIANKFCMDAMENIPNIGSLDTYFVKIYIRDLSENNNSDYEDYGLFTMTEQPNRAYLRRHGLDENGTIYKAMNFAISDQYTEIRSESDPLYNEDAFRKRLEIRENPDHDKLLEMTAAVNDPANNINDVIDTYFNRENYITWMAVNIIFGNYDSIVNNYLLYSPKNSKTWYFIPWDYDGTLLFTKNRLGILKNYPMSFYGLGSYWPNNLHKRFFKDPQNLQDLNKTIDTIMNEYLTIQDCRRLTSDYKMIYEEAVFGLPDLKYLSTTADEMIYYADNIRELLLENIALYYKNVEAPMPVFMAAPTNDGDLYTFAWDASYDFQGDEIYYTLYIARDPGFENILYTSQPMLDTSHKVILDVEPGAYYFKVLLEDANGNKQINHERYTDTLAGERYWAVMQFEVK